jgi:predicted RNA binding protein YcfA (HicA-like mRNA interferase family)
MRIPRDITGYELSKLLKIFGYEVTRQTGSHVRLTTSLKGKHHITIPNHNPIKIGTLSAILNDIANHFEITKEEAIRILF